MACDFQGEIELDVRDSTSDWDAFLPEKAPAGAPTVPGEPGWNGAASPPDLTVVPGRDPERVRSMLSRFQSSQRAGRAVATLPTDQPVDPRPRPPEEDR